MHKIRVLVVENQQALQQWLRTSPEIEQVDMQVVHNSQDIADHLDGYQPDIIILNKPLADVRILSPIPDHQTLPQRGVYYCGDLEVNFSKRLVRRGQQVIHLTPTEYDLLGYFVQHTGEVLSHDDLLQAVREDTSGHNSHLMRVHISNLRHKIEADSVDTRLIETIPGIGYRFCGCISGT